MELFYRDSARIRIVLITFLCLFHSAASADEWTKTDTGLQLIYTGLHLVDWSQTLKIAKATKDKDVIYRPDGDHLHGEKNNILGREPSRGKVNRYFLVTGIGHFLIAKAIKRKWKIFGIPWRNIWQSSWIWIEYDAITHNKRNGFGFSIPY